MLRSFVLFPENGLLVLVNGAGATQTTGAARCNQTDLLAGRRIARHARRVANVLVVTTTVRVVNGVHGHTTHHGPAVSLGAELPERTTGLEDRLVNTTATRDEAHSGAAARRNRLLGAARQFDARAVRIEVVANDRGVVARRARKAAAVTDSVLDVANDRAFGHLAHRQNVADGELRLGAAVHVLARVNTLRGNERVVHMTVLVHVTERHLRQRRTTTRIVDDL
jgi:hypothetical protein